MHAASMTLAANAQASVSVASARAAEATEAVGAGARCVGNRPRAQKAILCPNGQPAPGRFAA
eukprot:10699634-Lingulodinium_polyedra.AAC.1